MQELKGNYCVISLDKYDELITSNIEKCRIIDKLDEKLRLKNNLINSLENYFFEKIILNEDYHLLNIKNYDFNDYHYLQLYNSFTKIGIIDNNYIENSIKIIVEKYKNKGDE